MSNLLREIHELVHIVTREVMKYPITKKHFILNAPGTCLEGYSGDEHECRHRDETPFK